MYKQNDTLVVERNLKKSWMIIGLVQTSLGSGIHHEPLFPVKANRFFPVKAAHFIAAPGSHPSRRSSSYSMHRFMKRATKRSICTRP